jgi:hypothetical protein
MDAHLTALAELSDPHGERGQELFNACNAELFPCDALAFAVLERSLNLLKGFRLLLLHGGYTTGVGLLRMQLDNVLRFHGVVTSADPHGIANEIINGVQLRTLKDRTGEKMTDARLVELLAARNPWVNHVYALACSYIHLSDQHIQHFLLRSKKDCEGKRGFAIGDEDEHVESDHKTQLINAFAVATRGVLELVGQWAAARHIHGTNDQLNARFPSAI